MWNNGQDWSRLVENVVRHKSIKSQGLFRLTGWQTVCFSSGRGMWTAFTKKDSLSFPENPLATPERTGAITKTEPPVGSREQLDRVEAKDNIQQLAGKISGSGDSKLWGESSYLLFNKLQRLKKKQQQVYTGQEAQKAGFQLKLQASNTTTEKSAYYIQSWLTSWKSVQAPFFQPTSKYEENKGEMKEKGMTVEISDYWQRIWDWGPGQMHRVGQEFSPDSSNSFQLKGWKKTSIFLTIHMLVGISVLHKKATLGHCWAPSHN